MNRRNLEPWLTIGIGIMGNLLASGIQQEVLHNVFSPSRLVGTAVGIVILQIINIRFFRNKASNSTTTQKSHQKHQEIILATPRTFNVTSASIDTPLLLLLWCAVVICFLTYVATNKLLTSPNVLLADRDDIQPMISLDQVTLLAAVAFYPLLLTSLLTTYRELRRTGLLTFISRKKKDDINT